MAYYTYYIYKFIIKLKAGTLFISFFGIFLVQISIAQNISEIHLAEEYLSKGEKKKAAALFGDLSKSELNIPFIHNNYLQTLVDLGDFSEAQNYLKKISKKDPDNIQYQLDLAFVLVRSGDLNKAEKYIKELVNENKTSVHRIKIMADYFTAKPLANYATFSLIQSREALNNPYMFCLELATLYRIQNQRDKMVQEYLTYVTQNSGNIQYVKNVLQVLLVKTEDLENLEKLLYEKVQHQPDINVYSDLLIWVNLQQKNFYGAYVQARAFDKRNKTEGEKCMEVAKVGLDNNDYENAAKIYQYVIRNFSDSPNYLLARLGLTHAHEARVKNTFPVNSDSVKLLINDYKSFIHTYPDNINSFEAARNQGLLFANYLDLKDSAIQIFKTLIANPKTSLYLKSRTKIDLADTYLTMGQPWESTLLYSQVEKIQKENTIAYEAKLKNAKVSFYKGNFQLALEHLDVLKQATTREIANDAMELSMLIKENIAFDSTGVALKAYADIELLLYQNKIQQALSQIQLLKTETNNRGILDDVYWLEANIRMKMGEFQEAISLLEIIRTEFADDVLADDAYFLEGEINDKQLKNNEAAMAIYRDFLNKYPGSVFAAEARQRFRQLRGDFDLKNP